MDECVRWIESRLLRKAEELPSSRTRHKLWELPSRGNGRARLDCLAVSVFTRSNPWGVWAMAGQLPQMIPRLLDSRPWFGSTARTDRQVSSITTVTLHCWTTFRLPF